MRAHTATVLSLVAFFSLASLARAQNVGDIVITEVLANPGGTISDANGEWFELYNTTDQPIDLQNWFVQDSAASGLRPLHKIASSVCVPSHGRVILGNTTNTTNNGGVPVTYAYGAALVLANSLDRIRVLAPDSTVIDRAFYASASISAQNGISRELTDVTLDNIQIDGANWADALVTSVYGPGGRGTPQNDAGSCDLPVELVGFRAVTDGPDVLLTWETASETNNVGFEVEHFAGAGGFTSRGYVEGHGTTAEPQSYSYRVSGLATGVHRFRLRQVDYDGAFEHGPEVEVALGVPGAFALTPAYPNPFNPQTRLSLGVAHAQTVRVAAYDALGRRVAVLFDGPMQANQSTAIVFEAGTLPSGVYLIRAEGETFRAVQRVTLTK